MATKAQAKTAAKPDTKAASGTTAKAQSYNFNRADWPLGAQVAYTATRVDDHKGMTGVIVGYRPTNGLWVKFPNGKGSISVKTAKLVGPAPKGAKASEGASRKAPTKAAPKAKVTKPEPAQAEPAKTA